jgi:glycosyltransferase involved in cell wall biosynthesis
VLSYPYAAWRRWAKLVLLHSDALVARYRPHRGQSVAVIAHGIDVAPQPLPPPRTPAVGFFGRFEPYKGLAVLADAMKRVWMARPEVRLLITGTGKSEWELVDPRVDRVRGYLPEADVDQFLERVTVMALPYTEASQSGAGSVALGRGIPLVASRIGGLPELVLDESYLAEPGDDAGLAAVLLKHLDDGIAVRQRVVSELAAPREWGALGRLTLDAYADAMRQSQNDRGARPLGPAPPTRSSSEV